MSLRIKEYEPVFAALREQGWRVEETSQGHYRASPPNKAMAVVHLAQSRDPHALQNAIAQLRRSGFLWPPAESITMRRPVALVKAAEPDQAWTELKEAKELFDMAADECEECERACKEAQERTRLASIEREKAATNLRAKKEAFDKLFSGER